MILQEYLRIFGTENTSRGCTSGPQAHRARPPPWAHLQGLWDPCRFLSLIPPAFHFVFRQKKIPPLLKPVFLLILLPFSISLLETPFSKLFRGIVLWYVTPPIVQLVFALVLYILQIFAIW